jgi:DNA-binding NarL/FixJ family response regulator
MRRVLMGDFDALYRLGFEEILATQAVELIEATATGVLDRLVQARPDVVVLDQEKDETEDLVHRIVHDYPAIRVITCSSGTPTMRIFPSFHRGESYLRPLEPAVFEREVQG